MLLDTIADFILVPVVLFIFILFIFDLDDWEKMKKEVSDNFAAAVYITAFALSCLNLLLLCASSLASIAGDHVTSLTFDFFILAFTGLSVIGLFVSEHWKRKLRE